MAAKTSRPEISFFALTSRDVLFGAAATDRTSNPCDFGGQPPSMV